MVSGRNQTGLAGLGWTSNWDINASTDSQGNVTINEEGGLRYFALQPDGSYLPTLGDTGTLTALSGGGYQLSESDGSLTAFNANGTLNYVQDSNGNAHHGRLQLQRPDGQPDRIRRRRPHPRLQQPGIHQRDHRSRRRNRQLHLRRRRPSAERHDAAGNDQLQLRHRHGSAANALQTIFNPDGTQLNYTYDSAGPAQRRLLRHRRQPHRVDDGQLSLARRRELYGRQRQHDDRPVHGHWDSRVSSPIPWATPRKSVTIRSGNLTGVVLPGGTTYSYTYDLQGNLLSQTDGLGNTTHFTYDAKSNLTGYTDAKGNTTSYAYDGNNDLLSVTYANGAKQSYTYNPLGEATQFVNARGQAIGYTYNAQGQLTKETFADGTSYSYTYDAHGNLTSATDAQDRVTTFLYGGDPNNPNNPDLLDRGGLTPTALT